MAIMLMVMMSMSFTACGGDNDDEGGNGSTTTITITNDSGWVLPQFKVEFYNGNTSLSTKSLGTLNPGSKATVNVETGANWVRLSTFTDNETFQSNKMTITKNIKLTDSMLEGWGLIAAN